MKSRCLNRNDPDFKDYGGRGVSICGEWIESFAAFLAHIGNKPDPTLSLDRIDNNGNYEPGNVRWATQSVQNANRRSYRSGKWPAKKQIAGVCEVA